MISFKKYIPFIFSLSLLALPLLGFSAEKQSTVRAAIDIGSGATKLKVAEINLETQKIEKVLENQSFPVQYQEELEKSSDQKFNEAVMQTGLEALKKSKEIAQKYNAENVIAVATASFRKAANVQAFIDKIYQETGIKVYVIDQELEGALGFEAVTAQSKASPKDIVVWDIGGGSFQFSGLDDKGKLAVYRGVDASIPFKNHVIKSIKLEDPGKVSTPNPMTPKQIKEATSYAKKVAKKVDELFNKKMKDPKTKIVGIGNIFSYGIYPLVGKKSQFTKQDLSQEIQKLAGKTDNDLGGGDYVNVEVTNPILVLGFMDHLKMHQVEILDINNADGALLYAPFWEKDAPSS